MCIQASSDSSVTLDIKMYISVHGHLRLLNHYLFLSQPVSRRWDNFGKSGPCLECLFWTWFSNDSHFAFISSVFLLMVETTRQ